MTCADERLRSPCLAQHPGDRKMTLAGGAPTGLNNSGATSFSHRDCVERIIAETLNMPGSAVNSRAHHGHSPRQDSRDGGGVGHALRKSVN